MEIKRGLFGEKCFKSIHTLFYNTHCPWTFWSILTDLSLPKLTMVQPLLTTETNNIDQHRDSSMPSFFGRNTQPSGEMLIISDPFCHIRLQIHLYWSILEMDFLSLCSCFCQHHHLSAHIMPYPSSWYSEKKISSNYFTIKELLQWIHAHGICWPSCILHHSEGFALKKDGVVHWRLPVFLLEDHYIVIFPHIQNTWSNNQSGSEVHFHYYS